MNCLNKSLVVVGARIGAETGARAKARTRTGPEVGYKMERCPKKERYYQKGGSDKGNNKDKIL